MAIPKINLPKLDDKDVIKIVYDIMNDKQRKEFEEFFETDFSLKYLIGAV